MTLQAVSPEPLQFQLPGTPLLGPAARFRGWGVVFAVHPLNLPRPVPFLPIGFVYLFCSPPYLRPTLTFPLIPAFFVGKG